MPTNGEATLAASTIIGRFGIQQEPLSTVEEIPVKAHFPLRGRELLGYAYQFIIRILIGGFLLYAGISLIGPVGFITSAYVLAVLVLLVWAFVKQRKLRVDAWLKFEPASLTIRTNTNFVSIVPKTVQWKSPQMFLLTGSRRKVLIYSATHEEAAELVAKIREKFPRIDETAA